MKDVCIFLTYNYLHVGTGQEEGKRYPVFIFEGCVGTDNSWGNTIYLCKYEIFSSPSPP